MEKPNWEIYYWFNMDEYRTHINVSEDSKVRVGENLRSIYVNDGLIDLDGTISKITDPNGNITYQGEY